jgi:hypothetical protein
MVENSIQNSSGDALSRLIQLHAGRHDIRLSWVGRGTDDLIALCNAHAVKACIAKHLWTGMRELMQMPEMTQLPEAIQAQITSIILKSQVLVDLDNDSHAKRLIQADKPKGST